MGLPATVPLIVGLTASAAGTAGSMAAAAKARAAMNKAIAAQIGKQRRFQSRATPIYEKSLEESSPGAVAKQLLRGEREARGLYSRIAPTSELPVDETRLAGQIGQQIEASAQGQGYAMSNLMRWLKNMDVASKLQAITGLSQASAANAGPLASLAGNTGASLAGISSLLSTGGNLAAIYGGLKSGQ